MSLIHETKLHSLKDELREQAEKEKEKEKKKVEKEVKVEKDKKPKLGRTRVK